MFFDKETGIFNLDKQVQTRASFHKVMQDQLVTEEEIKEQSHLVISLFKESEKILFPGDLEKVNNALAEMDVLYAISRIKQLQDFNLNFSTHGNIQII
ncbi:MAG: hypothetical protein AB2L20_04355 [Mangrovibacterium sp.]